MGKYIVKISKSAEKDPLQVKKSGKKLDLEKINLFFQEVSEDPREGSGRPEQPKYYD